MNLSRLVGKERQESDAKDGREKTTRWCHANRSDAGALFASAALQWINPERTPSRKEPS